MIDVLCPSCHKKLLAAEEVLHGTAQCPACQHIFPLELQTFPAPPASPRSRVRVTEDDDTAAELAAQCARRRPRTQLFEPMARAAAIAWQIASLFSLLCFLWGTLFLIAGISVLGAHPVLDVAGPLVAAFGIILILQPILKAAGRWP